MCKAEPQDQQCLPQTKARPGLLQQKLPIKSPCLFGRESLFSVRPSVWTRIWRYDHSIAAAYISLAYELVSCLGLRFHDFIAWDQKPEFRGPVQTLTRSFTLCSGIWRGRQLFCIIQYAFQRPLVLKSGLCSFPGINTGPRSAVPQ